MDLAQPIVNKRRSSKQAPHAPGLGTQEAKPAKVDDSVDARLDRMYQQVGSVG